MKLNLFLTIPDNLMDHYMKRNAGFAKTKGNLCQAQRETDRAFAEIAGFGRNIYILV